MPSRQGRPSTESRILSPSIAESRLWVPLIGVSDLLCDEHYDSSVTTSSIQGLLGRSRRLGVAVEGLFRQIYTGGRPVRPEPSLFMLDEDPSLRSMRVYEDHCQPLWQTLDTRESEEPIGSTDPHPAGLSRRHSTTAATACSLLYAFMY
jgi:hypothetical protein